MATSRKNPLVRLVRKFFGSIFNSFQGFGNLFSKTSTPRRRNADFDKAGNELNVPQVADRKSTANIKRAVRERDLEVLNAVRQEKKMLRRKDSEAQEYRKAKEVEKVQVSRGQVISHLATVQRKAAEKKKADQEKVKQDEHLEEQSRAEQSKNTAEQNGKQAAGELKPSDEN